MTEIIAKTLRVLRNNEVVGAAFAVTDNLIVTCAHVIQGTVATIEDKVSLEAANGKIIDALVIREYWRDENREDIAFLRPKHPLDGLYIFTLGSSAKTEGHTFLTIGYTNPSLFLTGSGEVIGTADREGIPLLQLRSQEITIGFSGAPVFDKVTERVIGMITAIARPDKNHRLAATALAVRSETIQKICLSDINPYRGLETFTEEHETYFFGREQTIDKMLECLEKEPRFLAILGPSGSGKTSVVQSGLIPALKHGGIAGSENWGFITVRPTENPSQQFVKVGFSHPENGIKMSIYDWLKENPKTKRLVLIFDQFEEVLVSQPEVISQKFIAELADLISGSSRVTLIIVLQDHFYSRFLQLAGSLLGWFERGLINIPSTLEISELHRIIEEPARRVGLDFEEKLVDIIINDALNSHHVAGNMARSTILPLLEFLLTQLWQNRSAGKLTKKAYRTIGGVTGCLNKWADQIYTELDLPNQDILCRQVLIDLVRLGNPEAGIPDIRRKVPISNLVTNQELREEIHNIIMNLAKSNLIKIEHDHQQGQAVELIHNSLHIEWRLLRHWIDERRSFLTWKQKMLERYDEWKHDRGKLLNGAEIEISKNYTTLYKDNISKNLIAFIKESERVIISDDLHQRRQVMTIMEIAEAIGTVLNFEKTIEAINHVLHRLFEKTLVHVLLYKNDINALRFAPSTFKYYKIRNPEFRRQFDFPLVGKSIACRVARKSLQTGRSVCENVWDVSTDPDYLPLSLNIQSELCISMMSSNNELIGVLVLERYKLNGFTELDAELIKTVAQQLSVAIERIQQTEELELRSTIAAQNAWATDFVDEINNEVGQIRSWAYILRDRLKDDPELLDFARKIEESASVLSSIGPWSDLPPQLVKLDIFLDRNLANLTAQRNLNLKLHLNTPDVYIQVNPAELQRVLRQIVGNAAQAMRNSKVRKLMITTHSINSRTVEILLQDSGPGISQEVQLSIFQRPITTKGRGGYGLLLVRQMIEDMHGQIKLERQKRGQGAIFSIQFPIVSMMDGYIDQARNAGVDRDGQR